MHRLLPVMAWLCPPRVESLLSQACGGPAVKCHWPSKSYSLGSPVPWPDPQAGSLDVGIRTFTTVGELLSVLLFPSLWVAHLVSIGFGFIMIVPLLLLGCIFSFVLGCRISFFWWVSVSSCQWLFNNWWFGGSAGEGWAFSSLHHPEQIPSCYALLLCLWSKISSFSRFQSFLSMVLQQLVVISVFSSEMRWAQIPVVVSLTAEHRF